MKEERMHLHRSQQRPLTAKAEGLERHCYWSVSPRTPSAFYEYRLYLWSLPTSFSLPSSWMSRVHYTSDCIFESCEGQRQRVVRFSVHFFSVPSSQDFSVLF